MAKMTSALADVSPPETTVIAAVPATAIKFAGTEAVSSPVFTSVVANPAPFHRTDALATNPLPLTVSVKTGPPAVVLVGARDEMVTAAGDACVTGIERFDTNPYVVKAPDCAREPAFALALIFKFWLPVRSPLGADSQLGASRNHSQTLRLLDTDNGRVPPAAGKLRLGGEGVKLQELGFRVAIKGKVTLPLFNVTVSCTTDVVLFAGNVAVIVVPPTPDDGEMVWINESPVAVQAQDAGVVTKLHVR